MIVQFKRGGQVDLPVAPVEISDEVEMYARDHGRHATVEFVPMRFRGLTPIAGTWRVRLTLRANDKQRLPYQLGQVADEPKEDVWLHERLENGTYRSFDIHQMGASGVRRFLEKGNMWSGRGQFDSPVEQHRKSRQANETFREKVRKEQEDLVRARARDRRRSLKKIPFLPVRIDLTGKRGTQGE
jgi:hypothetical protein